MPNRPNPKIRAFILNNLREHPTDIVKLAINEFDSSRQTIHNYMKKLRAEGLVSKTGNTKKSSYTIILSENI